ncbi:carbohydrate ABC transporter permease [Pontiella desulfatans]|nr:carbohydrate ABC transporter permease [Pontiella desulfatans]
MSKTKLFLLEAALFIAALLFIMPVLLILLTSLKPDAEILRFQGILPQTWTLENYSEVFAKASEVPIGLWLFNSLFVSTCITILTLTVASLCAFALARLNLPRGKGAVALIVATMMVPGQILLVPVYLILNWLGWLDSPRSLIIPAGAGAFGVFLLYQFFKNLPRDLEDAAAIDGCSRLGIYWHVALPLSKSAMAALAIFTFTGSWNDFMGPLVFLESLDRFTLPAGIALFQSSYSIEYDLVFAVCVICTLPLLIVFLIFQKHIVKGISLSGLKE